MVSHKQDEYMGGVVEEAVEEGMLDAELFKEFFSDGLVELFDMLHEDLEKEMPDRCPSGLTQTPVSRKRLFSKRTVYLYESPKFRLPTRKEA